MYKNIRTTTVQTVMCNPLFRAFGNSKKLSQRFFYVIAFALATLSLNAQSSTLTWNGTTATMNSSAVSNLTVSSFTQNNNNGTTTMITTTSPSSGYAGFTGTSNFGAAARTGAIVTGASGSAYFELTLTPASGFTVSLTAASFGSRGTGTGPLAVGIRTNIDAYATNIATSTVLANSTWALASPTVSSVTSGNGTPLTIRLYGYNGTGSPAAGTANWRLDDIQLTVNVASAEVAPAAPSTGGNQSVCAGATIPNVTATAPSGAVVDWYANPTGGTALASNSSSYATGQTAAGVYTYYAESRNNPGTLKSATRTAITLTINANVAASVSSSCDDNTPTPGQTITFTATPTNGGAMPAYQWYKNSMAISGANSANYVTNSNYASGDVFYVEMISNAPCATPTTSTSANITITIDNSACSGTPPTASASATSTNICSGGSSSFSLTGLGAQTGYTFQWQTSTTQTGTYSDISGETNATLTATNITTTYWYRCMVTCSNSSTSTPSNAVQVSVTANATPSVSIVSSLTPACAGASVTYTASPTFGGTIPTYAWYKNAALVSSVTGATYSSSSFADGDLIYAVMTSNYACLATPTATSATALQNITPSAPASVSIASSANPACAGDNVTLTATPTNGGSSPLYQWYNGASPISGANNATYSSSILANNSSIAVVMTSNATCVTGSPATSNTVVQAITTKVTPSLTIASNNNPVCISGNATFNVSPVNAGTSATYAWYLNGVLDNSSTGTTFTVTGVNNNDQVYAVLTSSLACLTANNVSSNTITETVLTAPVTASVTIAASPGTTITPGTNITFTPTPTNGGTTPTYQWKLNGVNAATTATYSSTSFQNGDIINCVMTSNHTCVTSTTATSNNLTVTIVNGVPFTPGNLIVYRTGDSANNLVNTGNPVYLSEFTTSGQLVQNIRLTKTAVGQNSIFSNGTSTSEGFLNLSMDAKNITVPGYYSNSTNATSLSTTTSAAVNRVVCLVDRNINIDSTTRLSDWASGNTPRSAIANGNNIWVSGGAGGVRYAAKGATTSTQVSTSVTNLRTLNIFNGQLYTTSQSGAFRLATVGTGLPTTTLNTITNLAGLPTATGSPYGFYFADLSSAVSGYDVLYYADDNTGTLVKYSLVGGTWVLNNSIVATAIRGLTGTVNGTNVTLFGTTSGAATGAGGTAAARVYTFTDATGYNANMTGTISTLVDRSTASWIAYRGITFAPTGFTIQPTNTSACTGVATSLTCAMVAGSTPSIYTYQWQVTTNGTLWNNVVNAGVYTNATTATLNISDPSGLGGNQYRCQVTYMSNNVLTSDAATLTVNTTVTPSVAIATTTTTVCSGDVTTFTATPTNGGSAPSYQWKKGTMNVGTNSATLTMPANSLATNDAITCVMTANNVCQTSATATSNAITMTVKPSPVVAAITNGYTPISSNGVTYCNFGVQNGYYTTTLGGTWSSSNPAVVTVSLSSTGSGGFVTSVSNGTATISYSYAIPNGNGCSSTNNVSVIVAKQTEPDAITGVNTLCVGNTTTFASTTNGGVWSTTGRASINTSTGFATGTSGGTTTVKYTTTNANSCSASATKVLTVVALPSTPTIGYAPGTLSPSAPSGAFCRNKTFTLVGTPAGGAWTSTGVATITSAGVVSTGSILGAGSVTYTFTNGSNCISSRTIASTVVACGPKGTIANNEMNMTYKMYPNPTRNILNIAANNVVGNTKVIISNTIGKQVSESNLSIGNNTIDISNLTKGIYFVTIIGNNTKQTEKLIVE